MLAEPGVFKSAKYVWNPISFSLLFYSTASYCFSDKTKTFSVISKDLSDLDAASKSTARFCSSQNFEFLSFSHILKPACQ